MPNNDDGAATNDKSMMDACCSPNAEDDRYSDSGSNTLPFGLSGGSAGADDDHPSDGAVLRKNLGTVFELSAADEKQRNDMAVSPSAVKSMIELFELQARSKPPLVPTGAAAAYQDEHMRNKLAASTRPSALPVYLRIRPPFGKTKESAANTIHIFHDGPPLQSNTTVRTVPPSDSNAAKVARGGAAAVDGSEAQLVKEYEFTSVFTPEATQRFVYQQTTQPLVQRLFGTNTGGRAGAASGGESALLFCYGITNAGKTHTVLGSTLQSDQNSLWGVLPRALHDIFTRLQTSHSHLSCYLSYFELHNEAFYDLLPQDNIMKTHNKAPSNSCWSWNAQKPLKLRERHGRAVLSGVAEHRLGTFEQGLQLAVTAKQRRRTATNNLNNYSSRSHCICQITLHDMSKHTDSERGGSGGVNDVSLWVVDLAGSERAKRTSTTALRQQEAAHINKSLMTLTRCLKTLRENNGITNTSDQTVVPYRDSKLTIFFRSHLTSSAARNTAMIVNVNPAAEDYDETQHVLAYAADAKSIQIAAPAANTTSRARVEYGYDGRKKEKATTNASVARKVVADFVKKLSPKRWHDPVAVRKRKATAPDVTSTVPPAVVEANFKTGPIAKKPRPAQSDKPVARFSAPAFSAQEELILELQKELALARTELQFVTSENDDLCAQLDVLETQVRGDVAEEMVIQMDALRDQYEASLASLQQQVREASTRSLSSSSSQPRDASWDIDDRDDGESELVNAKTVELKQQVAECEEEILRMREEFDMKLEAIQDDYRREMAAKNVEIEALQQQQPQSSKIVPATAIATTEDVAGLQQQVKDMTAQVQRLEKSKVDLIKNYEQLWNDNADDQGDDDDEVDEEEDEDNHSIDSDGVVEEAVDMNKDDDEVDDRDDHAKPDAQKSPETIKAHSASTHSSGTTSEESFLAREENGSNATSQAEHTQHTRSSSRRPLESVGNIDTDSPSSSRGHSFGPSQWLKPKKSPKKDPKTGAFQRPRGRPPAKAESWDEHRGLWRMPVL